MPKNTSLPQGKIPPFLNYSLDIVDSSHITLHVRHKCGHEESYFYALEETARREGPEKAASLCTICFSNNELYKVRRMNRVADNT